MSRPINIFIIYAREDIGIKERLLRHLNPFKSAYNAVIWHDGNIEAGQEWEPHIESRLEQTDLFLMLVSIDFMNSEFINQVEFKYAIERHKAEKSIVIPIIINYCQWDIDIPLNKGSFNLNTLQVLPNEGKPIDDWRTPEQAYNNIAAGIRIVLSSIKSNREQELEKEKLELEKVREKTAEEQKQAAIKEKEREKKEQEVAQTDNVTLSEDKQEQEKQQTVEPITKIEWDNEIETTEPTSSRRKKIIIGAVLGVIILSVFLFRNSIWPNKRDSDMQGDKIPSVAQDSASVTSDPSTFLKTEIVIDENAPEQTPAKKQLKDPKTGAERPEGIKDEKITNEDEIFEKVETEASFIGGDDGWKHYLERSLNNNVAMDNGAPHGTYTVYVKFVVGKDGRVSNVSAITNNGYGMEDEAIKVIKKGPLWIPATQNGRHVNAYRTQAVIFHVGTK